MRHTLYMKEGRIMTKACFQSHADTVLQDLGGGTHRRVLAHDKPLMVVEVSFEAGAEGAMHSHPHVQCSYVLSGVFRYTVEDETVEMHAGDSIIVPGGKMHGTVCVEPGKLLDVFTPQRDDFL